MDYLVGQRDVMREDVERGAEVERSIDWIGKVMDAGGRPM